MDWDLFNASWFGRVIKRHPDAIKREGLSAKDIRKYQQALKRHESMLEDILNPKAQKFVKSEASRTLFDLI